MYSRRHAGPRAFIDGGRESAVVSAHSRQSKILVARGCSTRRRESPPRRSSGRLLSARLPPLSDELRADLRRRITHFANRAETVEELVMALHPEREPPFYGACELIGG